MAPSRPTGAQSSIVNRKSHMSWSRRQFLRHTGSIALGFAGLQTFIAGCGEPPSRNTVEGYGPLVPDPAGLLDLPEGFTYRVISRVGEPMSDGLFVPGAPDGMATFPGPDGRTLIVRNHETVLNETGEGGAFGPNNERAGRLAADRFYDPGRAGAPCLGGTTTLVYDTRTQELERQFLSLAGTVRNCAGGPTPWGSWLTCEESTQLPDVNHAREHGYIFEVPATTEMRLADPVPYKAMGRFNHEAVAVEPVTGVVYETEDRSDGLLYRFLPDVPGELGRGGRLQALRVLDQASFDTRNWEGVTVRPGDELAVGWIDLDDVESPMDDLRLRGFAQGAARFARGEGMWYSRGAVYIACTNGGVGRDGQIWRYTPSLYEGTPDEATAPARIELFIEPNDAGLIDNADNLTVAPWGDLFVCEDGGGRQYVVGVTPRGRDLQVRLQRDGRERIRRRRVLTRRQHVFRQHPARGPHARRDGSVAPAGRLMPGAFA